jgi:hypothetical protein
MHSTPWTSDAVVNAVLNDSSNLEIVLSNYFKAFIERLGEYDINLQGVNTTELLTKKVLDGIEKLEVMRKDFISVVEIFAPSNNPILSRYLPVFFEDLLVSYEERGVNLYTGTSADVLRNDHYRFFNQHLFISLTSLLLENRCFETLSVLLHAKYKVYDKLYGKLRDVNFIRFRAYNYTLNQFLNKTTPKRVSVTADYIRNFSSSTDFDKFVRADILLYYMSLWNHVDSIFDSAWFPELSVYNRDIQILPHMVSKKYFEKSKVLFDVNTVADYKKLLETTTDKLDRQGLYRVPQLQAGLLYDTVGSEE